MRPRLSTWWTAAGLTLALTANALASTRIYSGGVIVKVDLGKRTFVVENTVLHGYDWQNRHSVMKSFTHEFTTSNVVFLLDGQPVSPAVALKVGHKCRKIHIKSDGGVAEFFSADAPLLRPENAHLVLGLIAHVEKAGKPETQPFMQVRLEYQDGQLRRAFAGAGDGHPRVFGEPVAVDASGLKWADGKLSGSLKVAAQPPVTLTLDGAVTHAALWGTFTGKSGEANVTGEINGAFDYPAGEQWPPAIHLCLPAGWGGAPAGSPYVQATLRFRDPSTAEVTVQAPDAREALTARVEKSEFALTPGSLKGSFVMAVESKVFAPGTYTVRIATQNSLGITAGVGSAILKGTCELTAQGAPFLGKVGTVGVGLWQLRAARPPAAEGKK